MKRLIALFCSAVILLTLCGCKERKKDEVKEVKIISAHTAEYFAVALKNDGTVVGASIYNGDLNLEEWKNVKKLDAKMEPSGIGWVVAGITEDGGVYANCYDALIKPDVIEFSYDEENSKNLAEIREIKNAVDIATDGYNVFVLTADGDVIYNNAWGLTSDKFDFSDFKDVKSIYAGLTYNDLFGIKGNGTVVARSDNEYGQADVEDWDNIVQVASYYYCTIGLKSDGTLVVTDYNPDESYLAMNGDFDPYNIDGELDFEDWEDIKAIAAGLNHTVGLKSDGTVVATGDNDYGQCDVEDWKNIVQISCNDNTTYGVTKGGTVVSTGDERTIYSFEESES